MRERAAVAALNPHNRIQLPLKGFGRLKHDLYNL
jgi:hypothetical protein